MNLKFLFNCKVKTFMAVLLGLLSFSLASAQSKTINGNVLAEGQPLPGVSILVKGTNVGAVTDFDGNYFIKANPDAILVFSYVGYETRSISVNGKTTLNVTLQTDLSTLDEVVVVGYGSQKKQEVTGAVGQVKAEVLEQTTTVDIGAALQGQIAGVNVTSSSGAPGEASNILIRGFSSLMDGQNSPLYVVDGIPFDSDPQLSISEIETINVLKDAASTSIYGVRGAGGVILITTKQGKVGQMDIRFNTEYGMQQIQSTFNNMTREEYSYLHLLRSALNTNKPQGGVDGDIHRNSSYFTNDTDISDVLLNNNAIIENHSLNISGGNEGLTYNFNGSFFQQEGVFFNSNYKRFNVRANTQFTKGKWKIVTGLTFKRDDKLVPWGGMMNRIMDYQSFKPAIDLSDDAIANISEVSLDDPLNDWQLNEARNLANALRNIKTEENRAGNSHTGNLQVEYEVLDGLKLTTRFGATFNDEKWVRIVPRYDIYNTEGRLITNPNNITQQRITDLTSSKVTSEMFATYNKKYGKHKFNLLLGTSFEKSKYERYSLEVRNNLNPAITVLDNYELLWDIESGGFDYTRTLSGNIARLQYNFAGKYLLSASGRYDGSSQFSEGNRWGFFPSASVGWNVDRENFWKALKPVVNSFKIRAGYGTVGNDRFATYSNQTVVEPGRDYVFGSNDVSGDINNGGSEQGALGTTQLEYSNENLGWETSVEQNIGLDLGLFKNKFTITADLYKNEKKDLLYQIVNPPSTGVSGAYRNTVFNVGNMENTGFELGTKYNYRKNDFNFNISGTFTTNTNLVTKTSVNNPIIFLDRGFISTKGTQEIVTVITEGYEAASFFLRETAGIIKTPEQLSAYQLIDPSAQMGELMYVDQNEDGVIDGDDKVYAGSGTPDFETGLNISANYKGIDFSMQWYGAFGAEIMNGNKAYAYQGGVHKDLFYSWTENNTNANIPWYNGNNTRSYRGGSTFFLENGDFLRLRSVIIGFSFPKDIIAQMGLSKFRFYVQGQNLLTVTDYTGFDPEVGGNGLSTRGIDQGRYPLSSQIKAGIQLQF